VDEQFITLGLGNLLSNLDSLGLCLRGGNCALLTTARNCPIPTVWNYMD
jgi:hypothetical protein